MYDALTNKLDQKIWHDPSSSILAANALSHLHLFSNNITPCLLKHIPLHLFNKPEALLDAMPKKWRGYYFYENNRTDDTTFITLEWKLDGTVKGSGIDECGQFTVDGKVDFKTKKCTFTKAYNPPSDLCWTYLGVLDRFGMGGHWGNVKWGGVWKWWPDGDSEGRKKKKYEYKKVGLPVLEPGTLIDEPSDHFMRIKELNKTILLINSNSNTRMSDKDVILLKNSLESPIFNITFPEGISLDELRGHLANVLLRLKEDLLVRLISPIRGDVLKEAKLLLDKSLADDDQNVINILIKWQNLLSSTSNRDVVGALLIQIIKELNEEQIEQHEDEEDAMQ